MRKLGVKSHDRPAIRLYLRDKTTYLCITDAGRVVEGIAPNERL